MSRFPQALSGLCLVIPSPAYPFPEFCSDFSLPLPCGAVSGCCFLFFSVNVMMIWACHGMGNGYVDTPLFSTLLTYLSFYTPIIKLTYLLIPLRIILSHSFAHGCFHRIPFFASCYLTHCLPLLTSPGLAHHIRVYTCSNIYAGASAPLSSTSSQYWAD